MDNMTIKATWTWMLQQCSCITGLEIHIVCLLQCSYNVNITCKLSNQALRQLKHLTNSACDDCTLWTVNTVLYNGDNSNVFVLMLSCAPGPPTSLSILVRANSSCSVKGVVHRVRCELQFLGSLSFGIVFFSQNNNGMMSVRSKLFASGYFECVIKPNTQLVQTGLVWHDIPANRFSDDQLNF